MKVRVFEIAKQAGKTPQEVLDELKKRGIDAKSNLSQVEQQDADKLLADLASQAKSTAAAADKPKPAARRVILPAAKPEKPLPAAPKPEPAPVAAAPAEPEPAPLPEAEPAKAPAPAPVLPAPSKPEPPKPIPTSPLTPGYRPPAPQPKPPAPPARPAPIPTSPLTPGYRPPAVPPRSAGPAAPGARPGAVAAKPAPAAPAKPGPAGIGNRPASAAPAPKGPGQRHHLPHRKDRENLTALKQPPKPQPAPAPKPELPAEGEEKKVVKLPESVTVSELADRMGLKSVDLIKKLMEYKIFATINQRLANDVAQTLALDFGFETEMMGLYGEDLLAQEQDDPARLVPRPPVVTIMGHVDHGKTSLLDAIRKTDVAAGESGGITQHIGAYRVHLEGKGDVVFLDTPGHAAFTQMRARGAAVTDVVVLVVAADDGVQPQTMEAIDHAKAANVPIVVAINKIDKEGANPDRVMQELAKHNLLPEEWGGKTVYVQVSAKKRLHLDRLLELLVLESSLLELKADPGRNGKGVVIEAKLDKGRGPVATVLVQSGTVRVGDLFVAGNFMGHVRALINDKGKKVDEAGPATPVEVLGFAGVPAAGDGFNVVENERMARQISQNRMEAQKERDRSMRGHVKLEGLFDQISQGDLKELHIIIKADVSGSAEAIKDELERVPSDKVKVRVIHAGVGSITESDVALADASNALVLGFHTKVEGKANDLAKEKAVEVRLYDVIYDLVNSVKAAMEGLLTPQYRDVVVGKAEVRGIFKAGGSLIAGAYVTSGKVERKNSARLLRGEAELWKGKLGSLRRFKDDVKEVTTGMEFGVGLEGCSDVKVGDLIEFFTIETIAQKL